MQGRAKRYRCSVDPLGLKARLGSDVAHMIMCMLDSDDRGIILLAHGSLDYRFMTVHYFRKLARNGCMKMIDWAWSVNCPWDASVTAAAASRGRNALVAWFHKNGCPVDTTAVKLAAKHGEWDTVKWLYSNRRAPADSDAIPIERIELSMEWNSPIKG